MADKFIPLSVPNIHGNELKYVTDALKSEWVSTAGQDIAVFEKEFSSYLEIENACAVQSGTAGLHLCLRHFGIGPEDIVLVPTLTFIATVNPILYQNAEPIFFDCDDHLCIDAGQIKEYLEKYCIVRDQKTFDKKSGKCVKAVIPVHIFGDYARMDDLMALAEKYHLFVIEDATEALGTKVSDGKYKDSFVGTIGDAAVFSFNGNKIITTGGGGMVVSKNKAVIDHIRYLSQQAKDDAVYFINNEIGYNYRMTNVQAAMGRGQLERLNEFVKIKQDNLTLYEKFLSDSGYLLMTFRDKSRCNCWFYSLLMPNAEQRDAMIRHLSANNIQSRPVWMLNHRQKPFLKYRKMPCPKAETFYDRIVNIPCSTNLTPDDIRCVCDTIISFSCED